MWESSKIATDKVGRKSSNLSPASMANLDALLKTYKPSHATTNAIFHGGHNILYGSAAIRAKWNSFQKKFPELHNQVVTNALE